MSIETQGAYKQNASGLMSYPRQGTFNRLLFKTPLLWWRSGLGGALGGSMLVLTTWGRKTHLPRHTMLSYTQLEGRIYVGAGWGEQCDWYRNLQADPHVTLQVWSERITGSKGEVVIPALARRVTDEDEFRRISQRLIDTGGDSHFKPWLESLGIGYDVEEMVQKRERIRQVRLEFQPTDTAPSEQNRMYPPAMDTDLKWIWLAMAGTFTLGWLLGRRTK